MPSRSRSRCRLPTRRRASVTWAAASTWRTPGPAASTSSGSTSSSRSTTSAWRRSNSAGSTRLATIADGVDAGLAVEPVEQLDRLGDRHLLGRRDDDEPGPAGVLEDVGHPPRLLADQPDLDELADHPRGGDLGDDVAARLGVDDDEVVVALAHLVGELADGEDLLDARRGVGDEVERAGERADAPDERHLDEQPQVLAQRVLGVHRHGEQVGRRCGAARTRAASCRRRRRARPWRPSRTPACACRRGRRGRRARRRPRSCRRRPCR